MKGIIGALLAILTALVFLPKSSLTANANPEHSLRQRIFVHFPQPERGKKPPPKPPAGPSCSVTGSDQVTDYLWVGWTMPVEGVTYKINALTAPRGIQANVVPALEVAFATWTAADLNQIFANGGTTDIRTAKFDGENVIAWKGIESGAIAITYVWYWSDTRLLAEVDTMFNKNLPWAISPYSQDCIESDAYDVQNIATHEFGHWVGLDDLYATSTAELTMYGYGALGELKKDTLGVGDIDGVRAVAP